MTGRFLHKVFSPTLAIALFDWPCTTIRVAITTEGLTAGSLAAELDAGGSRFLATVLDASGGEVSRLFFNDTVKGSQNYTIAQFSADAPAGNFTVELAKLTEASYFIADLSMNQSVATFYGLHATGVVAFAKQPPPRPARRIEFFGASDTAGFGVDGQPKVWDCLLHMVKYESCVESYSSLLARQLDAEMHLQAWSGKGLIKNAVNILPSSGPPLPAYVNRSLATDWSAATTWQWSSWTPDLIVVSLGGNDYNNIEVPTEPVFRAAYHALLDSLFEGYAYAASAPAIANICGGGSHADPSRNRACPFVKNSSMSYQQEHPTRKVNYIEVPVGVVGDDDIACLGHHDPAGQQKFADYLGPKLKAMMGW